MEEDIFTGQFLPNQGFRPIGQTILINEITLTVETSPEFSGLLNIHFRLGLGATFIYPVEIENGWYRSMITPEIDVNDFDSITLDFNNNDIPMAMVKITINRDGFFDGITGR